MIFFKKNYFLFLLFFFTLHQFQFFTNFFIILKNDYTTRMIKYSGYCENEGYGYIKFIKEKFKINENFLILSVDDIKISKQKIDKNDILKNKISFIRNQQLERFSLAYFNKIKQNIQINEL